VLIAYNAGFLCRLVQNLQRRKQIDSDGSMQRAYDPESYSRHIPASIGAEKIA
jgi:hypothetical protein